METKILTDVNSAKEVTRIHMQTFPGFFLTFLGEGFLDQLYKGFITHVHSAIIGAIDEQGKLVGFVAYSEDISQFYKYLIKESLLPFAWYSLLAFLKRPSSMFRLLRAFTYSESSKRDEAYIELASIGVLPKSKNQGVGRLLIDALKYEVRNRQFVYIKLETDKLDNPIANEFYLKNGFILADSFTTREGREMNEYRYPLKDCS